MLIAAIGLDFWRHLKSQAEIYTRTAVDADWDAAIGYLHFDNGHPEWVFDSSDPEEAYAVERLRHVYMLVDQTGDVLQSSTIYESIGLDTTAMRRVPIGVPEYSMRRDKGGTPYMVRAGWFRAEHSGKYFLAMGRSLAMPYWSMDRFVRTYSLMAVGMLILASVFSWWLAGVAVRQGAT
jgi:hypothetical protein